MNSPTRSLPPASLEPTAEEMRALGYMVVDRIVERWTGLAEGRPHGVANRSQTEARIDGEAPATGQPIEGVVQELLEEVFPLAGRIDHPRFMAFIPGGPTWPSVLGDFLTSGFNVFQGTWLESAGPSQVELHVLEWFRSWLSMPEGAGGLLTSGGSAANLLAVVLAREVAGNPRDPLVYLSDQGHGSLQRACRLAGIPAEGVRALPTGPDFALDPAGVREALSRDRAEGRTPIVLCANGGATNTGAVDPLRALREVTHEFGVRLHVDAAYGGFGALATEGRRLLDGIGEADSITLDPHKWLYQPYDCGCLLVRDPRQLHAVFSATGEYLQDVELGQAQVNFADRGLQLSRRFRALPIWLSVKTLGVETFREAIGGGIELGTRAGEWVAGSEFLELMAPPSMGIVCYRFNPRGSGRSETELAELNTRIQARLVEEGSAMVSSTRLRERYALRLCILNYRTRWEHVESVLSAVEAEGRRLMVEGTAS